MAKGGHNNKVCAIKACLDYHTFVSGGWDQNLIFWDVRKKEPIEQTLADKVAGESIDIRSNQLLMGYAQLSQFLHCRPIAELVGYPNS